MRADIVRDDGRTSYAAPIADLPLEGPLDAGWTVQAFDPLDEQIGAGEG